MGKVNGLTANIFQRCGGEAQLDFFGFCSEIIVTSILIFSFLYFPFTPIIILLYLHFPHCIFLLLFSPPFATSRLLHLLLLGLCNYIHGTRFRFCSFCPTYRCVPITHNYSLFPVVLKPELRKGRPHLRVDITRRPTPRRQSLNLDAYTTAGPYGIEFAQCCGSLELYSHLAKSLIYRQLIWAPNSSR